MNDTNRMVSVPRELLEQALDAAAAVGMQDVADELDRILTPKIEQSQGNLLPCPFCGGIADSRCTAGPYPEWFVECTECRASASVFNEDKLDGWNKRVQPAAQATPTALMLAMENLAVKASVADHPPVFLPASVRQVPLVILGGVCLRVSYSGLKWYHDQLIEDRWEPLSVDEFEALLTDALRDSQGGNR